jgi:hypothetical protein
METLTTVEASCDSKRLLGLAPCGRVRSEIAHRRDQREPPLMFGFLINSVHLAFVYEQCDRLVLCPYDHRSVRVKRVSVEDGNHLLYLCRSRVLYWKTQDCAD